VASESNLGEQVGKQAYPSFEEATIDLKVVCENPYCAYTFCFSERRIGPRVQGTLLFWCAA